MSQPYVNMVISETSESEKTLIPSHINGNADRADFRKLLMEMRDGQAYRLVGPYDTFEDYCKDVEGLAYSVAQHKIKAYIVHKAIVENLGHGNPCPSTETQVQQLFIHENAIARFKTEKRTLTTKDGTERTVEVPVAVANPKKVADQWAAIVKAHEAVVARTERDHARRRSCVRSWGRFCPKAENGAVGNGRPKSRFDNVKANQGGNSAEYRLSIAR